MTMPEPGSLLVFMAAALMLNITPGPDMLYVIARSTAEGRPAGIASALGIGAGTLFHIIALALGVSALLAATPRAYDAVRWGGAAYLIWLGVRALLDDGRAHAHRPLAPRSLSAVFWQGALTNVLNPKVALFFLAFLPQFVDPARGPAVPQLIALGLLFDLSGTIVNLVVALGAARIGRRVAGDAQDVGRIRALRTATGLVFIALGARLMVAGRPDN